jgi:hypothetical protein
MKTVSDAAAIYLEGGISVEVMGHHSLEGVMVLRILDPENNAMQSVLLNKHSCQSLAEALSK